MGRIHSVQTMGLVDGPGIRSVVFLQGCSLRCAYCHNPDTWDAAKGQETTAPELAARLRRYKPYFTRSGGGVTCSGGEPLLQRDFVLELFRLCKEEGIHTALDTAGVGPGGYEELLRYTDLVLLDIKHSDPAGFKDLTMGEMRKLQEFITALNMSDSRVWVRHVVVPGITDGSEHLARLQTVISTIAKVDKIELLPYHQMGVHKYRSLGLKYRLEGIPAADPEQIRNLEQDLCIANSL